MSNIQADWVTGNASLPATGSLHVPETLVFLGILKARDYFSGGQFKWNWDGRNHVTVSELSLECPPAAWADVSGKQVCRCEYQASARNMEFAGSDAEIINGMAYITTTSMSGGPNDVIRKTLCDGEVRTELRQEPIRRRRGEPGVGVLGCLRTGPDTGRPATETYTTLPIDRGTEINGLIYGKNNKIADCGWVAEGAQINDWEIYDPSYDIDDSPSYGSMGDGLVTLEEYRGFKVYAGGGTHRRTNPFHKDIFIGSTQQVEGISYAYPALPTSTHRVDLPDMQANTYSINWLADGIAGHKPQCGLRMIGNMLENKAPWEWGFTPRRDHQNLPGTPCEIDEIDINVYRIMFDNIGHNADISKLIEYTIGHEAGHGVNIHHRDCECGAPHYALMCTSNSIGPPKPPPAQGECVFSQEPTTYDVEQDLLHMDLINP